MIKQNREYQMRVARLLRVYEKFKKFPQRTFVAKDFGMITHQARPYLEALVGLKLVEKIGVIYKCGNKSQIRKEVKGYKKAIEILEERAK